MKVQDIVTTQENAQTYKSEGPQPLYRELPTAPVFPVQSLGEILANAAIAVREQVQSPLALGAQSVLSAAAIAVQGHINIELPTGAIKPVSLYLLTVGESGERKSSGDQIAMKPIRQYEASLREKYKTDRFHWKNKKDTWEKRRREILNDDQYKTLELQEAALNALGETPLPPLEPILTCEEPTYAALCKTLETGMPSIGIFSDEGGEFIGGHAMEQQNKLRTIAGLSKLWDGQEIKRVRVADGNSYLCGKRLALHLMVQPDIASQFLSDPLMANQGFLSRFLFTYPESTMGTRLWKVASDASHSALERYASRLNEVLNIPLPISDDGQNQLTPRTIPMTSEAIHIWTGFYNSIEAQLRQFGDLRHIAGFANKLCENASRMAAIIAFFENPGVEVLSGQDMANGIELAQYYLQEAQRLFMVGQVDSRLKQAQKLLDWLRNKWTESFISVSDILQYGPNAFRDRAKILPVVELLYEYGWLIPHLEPIAIRGKMRREAWQIVGGNERDASLGL